MKRWLWLGILLLLQGCSALKLGYNQLPTVGYWWLDSQLALEGASASQTREALQQWQQWHRQQELPQYADVLRKLQDMSSRDIDAQQVCDLWSQVDEAIGRSMAQAIRLAAPIAQQLQPRQLRHLARHLEDKNEDWEKEWLVGSAQDRLKRRLDRTLSRYGEFYGTLNEAQIERLRQQLQKSTWSAEWGRQERLRRQQLLLGALNRVQQGGASVAQTEAALTAVWQQWLSPPSEADRGLYNSLLTQSCRHLAELHNSTSPEQRQRAQRRLRAYEKDLRELAGRP